MDEIQEIDEEKRFEFDEGFKARYVERKQLDCPYRFGDRRRHIWLSGWNDANMCIILISYGYLNGMIFI